MGEIKKKYFYINEQNAAIACSVFEEKCQELLQDFLQDLKINFPPRRVSNLTPRLIELADKLNVLGLLCTLRQNGKLDSPFEQQTLLQELEKKNIGYERYLEKKAEALQDSINKQKELVQELMEMSKIGHEKLMEAMLMDFDKMLESYHKLDLLRQEIERLEKQLELIREQLQEITQKLTEITEKIKINEAELNNVVKIINIKSLLLQTAKDNRRQKYEEAIRDLDPVHMQKLTAAFSKLKIDSNLENIQNYKKELRVFFNTILTHNELQNTDAVLNYNAAGKSIAEFKDKLAILTEQLKQNLDGLKQSQEEMALRAKEKTSLEEQIAAAEEERNGFDEQIKTFSNKNADLASKLTKLKEIPEDSSQIEQLTKNLTYSISLEIELKEKKAQLIEQIAPLEQQKEKLEQQQTALIKEKEIKQEIVKEKEKEIAIIKINAQEKILSKTQVNYNKV